MLVVDGRFGRARVLRFLYSVFFLFVSKSIACLSAQRGVSFLHTIPQFL